MKKNRAARAECILAHILFDIIQNEERSRKHPKDPKRSTLSRKQSTQFNFHWTEIALTVQSNPKFWVSQQAPETPYLTPTEQKFSASCQQNSAFNT